MSGSVPVDPNLTSQAEAFRQKVRAFYAGPLPTRFAERARCGHGAYYIALSRAA